MYQSELGHKYRINTFLDIYRDIAVEGKTCSPRGEEILEIENYSVLFHPIRDRFTSIPIRKMNLDYMKFELLWYLRGDRFEVESIADKAAMWAQIKDVDGGINSNYGQYIFRPNYSAFKAGTTPDQDPMKLAKSQFDYVIDCLSADKDSRRGIISLLGAKHLRDNNPDVVCTYYIAFRIRENKLNMTIGMRSWDAIWGMTNDIFCFSCIYEMMYMNLRTVYPDLEVGSYVHHADSIHVYERHFKMLEKLVDCRPNDMIGINCPPMNMHEAVTMVSTGDSLHNEGAIPKSWEFFNWLLE